MVIAGEFSTRYKKNVDKVEYTGEYKKGNKCPFVCNHFSSDLKQQWIDYPEGKTVSEERVDLTNTTCKWT